MAEPNYPPGFEADLRKALDVPEPDAAVVEPLRQQFIARGVAALKVDPLVEPTILPVRPEKDSTMKPKTFRFSPRLAWGLALLVFAILLTLIFTSPTIVNALRRLLGYVPGVGLVESNSSFSMLAEPVSQTRDGVIVTVEKAILNTDNALIVYKVEGLSADKFSFLEPANTCMLSDELRFPNGISVKSSGGQSEPLDDGFESTYKYAHIPIGAQDATLFIPCIQGALAPGLLPENWELPLHFVPASPDKALTMLPVIETTPSSEPQAVTAIPSVESTSLPDTGSANSLTVTRFIDADDSYILIGEFNPPAPSQPGASRVETLNMDLIDGAGQKIDWQIPTDITLPVSDSPYRQVWAVKFTKGAVMPVHITCTARYVFPLNSQETYAFEFDAGTNPHLGQKWNLNKEFQFAGHTIHLTEISADLTGYFFSFESADARVNSLSAKIDGYTPIDHGGSVGTAGWDVYDFYSKMPAGKLKVILSDLYFNGETKDYSLDWQP